MKSFRTFCSLLLFSFVLQKANAQTLVHGAIVRGDSTRGEVSLVFTADEWGEGIPAIRHTLKKTKTKAAFFFTGRFYRNKAFQKDILRLKKDRHYFGPHSDGHLLYCDWAKRDSLLVSKDSFDRDLAANIQAMQALGLQIKSPHYFIPPFEWWNDSIAAWSKQRGLQLLNFSPGVRTNADYTWPQMGAAYKGNGWLMRWLEEIITANPAKLNGAILLIHAGTDPRRKEKFYGRLGEIIRLLKSSGYRLKRLDDLLLPR